MGNTVTVEEALHSTRSLAMQRILLDTEFFPAPAYPGAPWWSVCDPPRGRMGVTLSHTTTKTYRRKDGLLLIEGEFRGSETIYYVNGTQPIKGSTLLNVMATVDKEYPMRHPGIRPGQLWRLIFSEEVTNYGYPLFVDAYLSEVTAPLRYDPDLILPLFVPDTVRKNRFYTLGGGQSLSETRLRLILDPCNRLGEKEEIPESEVKHTRDLPVAVILLADPHFPHLAPFYAWRKA